MNLGNFTLGSTFDAKFTTIDSTGLASALTSGAVAAYPGNSVTEITAGITLSADFDARTGLNNVRVVATSGNGYAAGTNYVLVLTAGTVDSVSVAGYVIAHFSIENRSVLAVTNPVSVSTISTPVGVSSASLDFGVSTIAAAQKLVGISSAPILIGVSTLSVPVGVSSYSRNSGVSTVAVLVGVSTLAVPVGVSSASLDFGVSTIAVSEKLVGVSTIAATQKLVGVSTMSTPVGVSSASVDFGVSTLAVTEKLVGVSTSIMVSSNIVQLNGVTIVGDGSGTPWGPA